MGDRYRTYDCDEVWDSKDQDTLSVEAIVYLLNDNAEQLAAHEATIGRLRKERDDVIADYTDYQHWIVPKTRNEVIDLCIAEASRIIESNIGPVPVFELAGFLRALKTDKEGEEARSALNDNKADPEPSEPEAGGE